MKIKLIKKLNIKYKLIPDLSRTDRRMLQRGAKVEVSTECGSFLISKGFAEEVIEWAKVSGRKYKATMHLVPSKSRPIKNIKSTTKNDGDESSNNEEAL